MSEQPATATFLGHPKGLFVLFLTEMWERFSYYGMRALLILFLVDQTQGGFGWSKKEAFQVYGYYTMSVYLLGIVGGVVADRYIGQKLAVWWGGALQCVGHFLLALSNVTLFMTGLGFIALGTGFLKPNISTMVGSLYKQGDPRRDGGFTIFYMGINIGAIAAAIIVGIVGEMYGWHYGFSLGGFGVLLGMSIFFWGQHHLQGIGQRPTAIHQATSKVATPKTFTREEKDRLVVLTFSFLAIMVFFAAFEQAGGLMSLYTKDYTDRHILGWEIPASVFQALNPTFVILFSPIIAWIWIRMAKTGRQLSSLYKMGLGNIIVGLGFLFMVGAVLQKDASAIERSSMYWLVGAYLFHTIGEICLSTVSLSFITKVAPQRVRSSMMGAYFAVIGVASYLASELGTMTDIMGDLAVFRLIFFVNLFVGLLFILFDNRLKKLIHGAEEVKEIV